MIRSAIRNVFPKKLYGRLQYLRDTISGNVSSRPLNGQRARCLLFADIVRLYQPELILETGTFRGATSEWLAAFQIPIHTFESDGCNYGYASARLAVCQGVTLHHSNSVDGLREVLHLIVRNDVKRTLIYLDAHWGNYLPLADELEKIYGADIDAVVVIDDFQVADDCGYAFDDYGGVNRLALPYIASARVKFNLVGFYPRTPSTQETGSRRGCLVLARKDSSALRAIEHCTLLREVPVTELPK